MSWSLLKLGDRSMGDHCTLFSTIILKVLIFQNKKFKINNGQNQLPDIMVGHKSRTLPFLSQHSQSLEGPLQALTGQRDSEHKKACWGHHLSLGGASEGPEASSHTDQPGYVGKKRPLRKVCQEHYLHHFDPQNVARWLLSRDINKNFLLCYFVFQNSILQVCTQKQI